MDDIQRVRGLKNLLEKTKNSLDGNVFKNLQELMYGFSNLCFESDKKIYPIFQDLISPQEISKFINFMLFLSQGISMRSGDNLTSHSGQRYSKSQILSLAEEYIKKFDEYLSNDTEYRVFYSWQSDTTDKYNRNFIEKAIEKAIKKINEKFNINVKLDKDTRDCAGSPDIINKILEKIDKSTLFIADVSITTRNGKKCYPNSNVMFELGYAIKSIGDDRVIMVLNNITGTEKELPFDLGLKRQTKYTYGENCEEDKEKTSEDLVRAFYNSLEILIKQKMEI